MDSSTGALRQSISDDLISAAERSAQRKRRKQRENRRRMKNGRQATTGMRGGASVSSSSKHRRHGHNSDGDSSISISTKHHSLGGAADAEQSMLSDSRKGDDYDDVDNALDILHEMDEGEDSDEFEATWEEVWITCCCHNSLNRYLEALCGFVAVLMCLFLFGLGLDFLSNGAKVMTGCAAGELFAPGGGDVNPIAGVMIGTLATVMLQSSSTTTSIIVGLVGAENSIISVEQAIFMVMGANIGTTVTNTMVSLSHFRDSKQFELAFAGATIHDLFNFMTVAVLLPVEVLTGYLRRISSSLTLGADTDDGDSWQGPVKRYISPVSSKILKANKKIINTVAGGGSCSEFYPIKCVNNDNPTDKTCTKVGLISCDKTSGDCPYFFNPDASKSDDQVSGFCVFVIGAFTIFLALSLLVSVLQRLLVRYSARVIFKVTRLNGYVLIAVGTMMTMLLQSSSTTTSFLTPFVAMGAIPLEQMFALTIGANLGTTVTALLAAMATEGNSALQVAVAHLIFNLTGFMIWYPIPLIRNIPLAAARRLGNWSRLWQPLTVVYIAVFFLAVPMLVIGIRAAWHEYAALGISLTVIMILLILTFARWFYSRDGRDVTMDVLEEYQRKQASKLTLAADIKRVQHTIEKLCEFTGIHNAGESPITTRTNKSNSEALQELADDMDWMNEKLDALIYYTGIPDEFLDDETKDDDLKKGEVDNQFRPDSLISKIPRCLIVLIMILLPLFIWGIVSLWQYGTKGSRGFAGFFIILLVLCVLITMIGYFFARQNMMDYFELMNRNKAAYQSLADDMACAKSMIRQMFLHSNVQMETVRNDNNKYGNGDDIDGGSGHPHFESEASFDDVP